MKVRRVWEANLRMIIAVAVGAFSVVALELWLPPWFARVTAGILILSLAAAGGILCRLALAGSNIHASASRRL